MRRPWMALLIPIMTAGPSWAQQSVHIGVRTSSLQFDFLYRDYGYADCTEVEPHVAQVGESDFVVALYLAQVAGVDVGVVVEQRRSGLSWDEVTRRCRRDSRIYYVEVDPEVASRRRGA